MTTAPAVTSRTAVVLLNWRAAKETAQCVRALSETFPLTSIYVVDNESDGTLEAELRRSQMAEVNVLPVPENRGFSAGVNVGIRAAIDASFEFILAMNTDVTLDATALRALLAADHWDASTAMIAPVVRNPDGTVQSAGVVVRPATLKTQDLTAAGAGPAPDYLTWACVLVSVEALSRVGFLDERFFMYWEDAEFGRRIRRAGLTMRVVPGASIIHHRSGSHARAGAAISLYTSLGSRIYARDEPWLVRLGARVRLVLRVSRRLLDRNPRAAHAVVRGWRLAAHGHDPIYPHVQTHTATGGAA